MNLHGRGSLDPRYTQHPDSALDLFLSCKIKLYDQNLIADGAGYNWKTNASSGGASALLFEGEAQVQVYRFTLTMDAPAGSVDQLRNVRFTVKNDDIGNIDVRRGQMIRVTECPLNETLIRYQYVVNSGLNSGLNFRRTIETEVDMTRVVT